MGEFGREDVEVSRQRVAYNTLEQVVDEKVKAEKGDEEKNDEN
jgi:hypothetical protein